MKSGFYIFVSVKRLTDFCCHIATTEFLKAGKIKKFTWSPMIFFKDLSEDEFEQLKVVAERYQGVYEGLIQHNTSEVNVVEDIEDGLVVTGSAFEINYVQKPFPPNSENFMDGKFVTDEDYDSSEPEIRKVVWFILGLVAALSLFVFVFTR